MTRSARNQMREEPPSEPGTLRSMIVEMDGLEASMRVVDSGADPELARPVVEAAIADRQVSMKRLDEEVVLAAMLRIVGKPVRLPLAAARVNLWENHVTDTLALAWAGWAAGQPEAALRELGHLHGKMPKGGDESSAMHLMSLHYWGGAIEQLARGSIPASRRLFRRALDLGAQFGTESHTLVSWTYAATFFNDKRRLPPLAKCRPTERVDPLKVTSEG